jgi:hypothetical protein
MSTRLSLSFNRARVLEGIALIAFAVWLSLSSMASCPSSRLVVRESDGPALAFVYFVDEPGGPA